MAKKKIDYGFTPSEYQEKIFDFVRKGTGNGVIRATAGSGKTTSIITAMKLVPSSKKCLFIAFNKSIVEELTKKLEDYPNCGVRTLHSLGYSMIRRNFGNDIEIDEYKYNVYLKKNLSELSNIDEDVVLTGRQVEEYTNSIIDLINFARYNNAQSIKEIKKIAVNYDIPISFDECEVALKCLEWGKENHHVIDYTDMVWLPCELSLKPLGLQYDWVFFDEAQDASLISIQLFMKCFKRGTRFIAVGDSNQAINFFAGSSPEAFDFLCNYQNTTVFDLPITYRCAKSITKFANKIVKEMLPRENAPEGEILYDVHIKDIKEGDMVLSRSKTPLLKLYTRLLRRGVNCYIKGQDIGANLIKLLDDIDTNELNPNLDKDGVFVRLYEKLFKERDKLITKRGLDLTDATLSIPVMTLYDSINSLTVLAEHCSSKQVLISKIKNIFRDESDGVCLSTIHKAKGLEAENVYILCHSTMPSKLAHHDWEKIQERNLQYVAYTRPKLRLGFVSEDEIKPSGSLIEPSAIMTELTNTEYAVCRVTGREISQAPGYNDLTKFRVKTLSKIEETSPEENAKEITVTHEETDKKKKFNLFESLTEFLEKDNGNMERLKKFLEQ